MGGATVEFEFSIGGEKRVVKTGSGSPTTVTVDDRPYDVDWCSVEGGIVSLLVDGRSHTARVAKRDGGLVVSIEGRVFVLERGAAGDESFAAAGGALGAGGKIKAPMPGTVVKVLVSEGDEVTVNQSLVIVEAMKMENEVRSPVDGVVTKVNVSAGDSVGTTDAMVEVEPADAGE